MNTYEAIYDNGKVIFLVQPKINKARIKVTFLEELTEPKKELVFPTKNLGLIKEFNREDLYEEYLSDRF